MKIFLKSVEACCVELYRGVLLDWRFPLVSWIALGNNWHSSFLYNGRIMVHSNLYVRTSPAHSILNTSCSGDDLDNAPSTDLLLVVLPL
jgi:hypothetical protein